MEGDGVSNVKEDIGQHRKKPESFKTAKYVNGYFIFMALVSILINYNQCDVCKTNYQIPRLSELNQVTGKYVSFHTYKNTTYGGLLVKGHAEPMLCGYLKQEFLEQPATGWIDKAGKIYQIEVNGKLVCDYSSVVYWIEKKNDKFGLYASIVAFIVLCITQYFLLKFSKNIEE